MHEAAFNALPAHVAVVDAKGTILLVNDSWRRLLGRNSSGTPRTGPRADGVGVKYVDFCRSGPRVFPPWDEEVARGLQRVLAGEAPSFSLDYPSRDAGERRWLRMVVSPLALEGKRGAIVMHTDITGQVLTALNARTKEELNNRIIEAVPAGIMMVSNDGGFLTANAEAQRFFGLSFDDIARQDVTDGEGRTIWEDGRPCPVEEYPVSKCLRTREPQPAKTIGLVQPNGETIWAIYTAVPLIDLEVGSPSGALVTIIDISERKKAEAALRESEQRFRLLAESIREVFYIILPDASKALYISPAYEEIWGRSCESLYENPASWLDSVHPDDQVRVRTTLDASRKGGRDFHTEYRVVRPDGSVRWVRDRAFQVFDPNGRPYRLVGIVEDVTERKHADAAILAGKKRYEAAVQASGQILYDWDPVSGDVTYGGSHEKILGYTAEELTSKLDHWTSLVHPEDRQAFVREVEHVAITRDPFHLEYRVRRKDGAYLLVRDDGQFFADADGKHFRMVGFVVDITEQRRLEERLRQSHKMEAIGQLAGGIAHDFNNLLTVILGCTEGLLASLSPKDAVHRFAADIKLAGERAASLTKQLLALSRQQIFESTVIDLNVLLSEMNELLRRLIGDDTELQTETEPNLWPITADAGQITQVILNLAVNARDSMPNGGKVLITARNRSLSASGRPSAGPPPGDYVVLSVSDTGHGIDRETAIHIFEPFFTTKAPGKGTGLGLSTVYGIVSQSKGYIQVQSEVGHGSTFEVYLPRSEARKENGSARVRPEPASTGHETLLLVEDEETVRTLLEEVLQRKGYRVLSARSGPEALAVVGAHEGEIQLAVTDMIMPRMSGRELVKQLTLLRPSTRVLFMSGFADDLAANEAWNEHSRAFIQKPFTPEELVRKVRELLDRPRHAPK